MFFKCKVCQEKDKHVESLKTEISYLKSMLGVTAPDPRPLAQEAQMIMDGGLVPVIEIIEPNKDKLRELDKIAREAEMIFSGAEMVE